MLAEDEGFGDITSNAVVEKDKTVNAQIVSKDTGILAGIDIIRELFEEKGVEVTFCLNDGEAPISHLRYSSKHSSPTSSTRT